MINDPDTDYVPSRDRVSIGRTTPGVTVPGRITLQKGYLPRKDYHPTGQRDMASLWYASYWNAFLFSFILFDLSIEYR